jgi:hypothetical protein
MDPKQLGEKVYCTGDLISKIELAVRTPSQQLAPRSHGANLTATGWRRSKG